MTQYRNTFEGLTVGQTLSAAVSGGTSGAAFTQVSKDAASVMAGSATNPTHGVRSLDTQPPNSATATHYWAWLDSAGPGLRWAAQAYIKAAAGPTAEDYIFAIRSGATASALVSSLRVTTAGLLRMYNQNASASVLQTGTGITWSTSVATRIEAEWRIGATSAASSFNADWYVGESTTSSGHIESTGAGFDLALAPMTQCRFGRAAAVAGTWPAFWDTVGLDTASLGYMGPVPGAPPTGAAATGLRYVIDLRTYSPGVAGDALTYSLTQTSGPVTAPVEEPTGKFMIVPNATIALAYTARVQEGSAFTTETIVVPPASSSGVAGQAQVLRMVGGVLV